VCQAGRCACDVPWLGENCGVLETQPAQPGGMYNFKEHGYLPNGTSMMASWGGNILWSGTCWDLFVAEIPGGLIHWGTDGLCVHASSPNRTGPFVRQRVVDGPDCHNPQAIRDRESGDILLFALRRKKKSWLLRAKIASEPFQEVNTSVVGSCNNPAPAYHPNGTLFVVCNHNQMTHLMPGKGALRNGDWAQLSTPLDPSSCGDKDRHWEDPFLWFDRRGNWHIIYHVYCLLPYTVRKECFSGHAFSIDGLDWTFSATEPFDGTVHFVEGSNMTFSTRERPKFVFADTAMTTPAAVITGVSAQCSPPSEECCGKCSPNDDLQVCSQCKHPPTDFTYTVLQPFVGFEGSQAMASLV